MPSAARIEREIEIDAPIDVVWAVVTDPLHMAEWLTDSAELEVRPGGEGRMAWKHDDREGRVNVRVERVEPPHLFAFRWDYPDDAEPGPTNAPLVEFSLEAEGETTRLRLVESDLDRIDGSEDEKKRYYADHAVGWDTIVERLRDYAAEQRSTVRR
jgi:uncharacterized protein YndB with AHSA1/START domain